MGQVVVMGVVNIYFALSMDIELKKVNHLGSQPIPGQLRNLVYMWFGYNWGKDSLCREMKINKQLFFAISKLLQLL